MSKIELPKNDNNNEQNNNIQENLNKESKTKNNSYTELNVNSGLDVPFAETKKDEPKKFLSYKKLKKQVPTEDAKQTRKFAWLAYVLFFIPLLINKDSDFVKHNANQGLGIFIVDILALIFLLVGIFVAKNASVVLHLFMIIFAVIGGILLVLTLVTKIYMIIASAMGIKVKTPWMFNLKIIK